MKIFAHIFNTWLLTNFLHPFCWMLWELWRGDEIEVYLYTYVFIGGLFLSIPSLLIAWAMLKGIISLSYEYFEKLFLWYMAVIVSVLFGVTILMLIITKNYFSLQDLVFCIPAIGSGVIAITIRYKSFIKLNSSYNNF